MGTLSQFKQAITKDKLLQTTYYKVEFQNVPTFENSKELFGSSGSNAKSFDIYCQATDLPGKKLSVLEVKKHGFTLRMPNVIEYDGTWKTTVLVNLQLEHYRGLLYWQNHYSSLKNDMGGARGFSDATATVTILDNNFQEKAVGKKIKIYGIFPSEVPALSMKQDSSDYLNADCTFTYSYCDDYLATDPLG